ncbi:hypothetical protein E2I00_008291 [Balaenoptera physalus]|uniref:G-protein coupled receptors family 1 profile domain-containing protein n=1 Tax=Balaenoptera physalus TaxID=9770 RepID=A0A643BUJ3_BALPH|nr:hypothetical protein E2I00_008291 [Balaenoptera physalus]
MCPGVSEAPELYSRGFLTIEQITMLPPPAVMNYIFLLLCLCGLVGNGLVLWFFGFSIKRSPFSTYFLHLASADVGYLFSKAVFSILNTGGFLGSFADYVRAVSRILGLCMFVTSVSLLPAISSERCLHMDAFLGILFFLVFCPLMVLPCLALILHVECRARRRQRSAKLNHVILAMVSVFLVSSIYLGIDWFLFWVFQIPAPFPEYVTDLCICINSSAKPVVYFLAGRDKSQRLWEPLRSLVALCPALVIPEKGCSTALGPAGPQVRCPDNQPPAARLPFLIAPAAAPARPPLCVVQRRSFQELRVMKRGAHPPLSQPLGCTLPSLSSTHQSENPGRAELEASTADASGDSEKPGQELPRVAGAHLPPKAPSVLRSPVLNHFGK